MTHPKDFFPFVKICKTESILSYISLLLFFKLISIYNILVPGIQHHTVQSDHHNVWLLFFIIELTHSLFLPIPIPLLPSDTHLFVLCTYEFSLILCICLVFQISYISEIIQY